jgi:hypothetical protein
MPRHKSFGSDNPYANAEPVTFDLYDQTFTCKVAVQGAALLRFGQEASDNSSAAVMNFFRVVMDDDNFEQFEELIESEDKIVDAALLGEIAGYLVSEYSSRPTEPSSSSSNGRGKNARSSGSKR